MVGTFWTAENVKICDIPGCRGIRIDSALRRRTRRLVTGVRNMDAIPLSRAPSRLTTPLAKSCIPRTCKFNTTRHSPCTQPRIHFAYVGGQSSFCVWRSKLIGVCMRSSKALEGPRMTLHKAMPAFIALILEEDRPCTCMRRVMLRHAVFLVLGMVWPHMLSPTQHLLLATKMVQSCLLFLLKMFQGLPSALTT